MMYGDIIVNVANQVRPYEVNAGETDAMIDAWSHQLVNGFEQGKGMSRAQMRKIFAQICDDFASIPVQGEPKIRVGIVGEIYVKFAPLGNNTWRSSCSARVWSLWSPASPTLSSSRSTTASPTWTCTAASGSRRRPARPLCPTLRAARRI